MGKKDVKNETVEEESTFDILLQLLFAGILCAGCILFLTWILAMLGADGTARLPWIAR